MKFKEYMEHLKRIYNRETKELEVFFAGDDEGNCFSPVTFEPSIMNGNELAIEQDKVIIIN